MSVSPPRRHSGSSSPRRKRPRIERYVKPVDVHDGCTGGEDVVLVDEEEEEEVVGVQCKEEKEKESFAVRHAHERDAHIQFVEEGHLYIIDGDRNHISVTTAIAKLFPSFCAQKEARAMVARPGFPHHKRYARYREVFRVSKDTETLVQTIMEGWRVDGESASQAGTAMHNFIELHLNGDVGLESCGLYPERQMLVDFHRKQLGRGMQVYRTEWQIHMNFMGRYKVAGSIDAVYYNPASETYHLVDWKRSKSIKFGGFNGSNSKAVGKKYRNGNGDKYKLQLNWYACILKMAYNIPISSMLFVVAHPSNNTYMEYEVPFDVDTILRIMRAGVQ